MKNLRFKIYLLPVSLLILLNGICLGQNNYFPYTNEKHGTNFNFPVFSHATNLKAVTKINQLLQLSELQLLKGFEKEHIFELAMMDNGGMFNKKVELKCTVQNNSDKLLSIQIKDMSCGADCVGGTRYYNFNSGNGDLIQLKDLFTTDGYQTFYKYVTTKRVKALDQQLVKLDEQEKMLWQGVKICYEESTLIDFYIKDNTLFIDGENCFYNTQKVELIKRLDQFTLPEFKNYLNDYGKSLFSISSADISGFQSKQLPQLFEGSGANDSALIFILNITYQEDMRGIYAYTQRGIGVNMEGTLKGTNLYLAEIATKPGITPYIYAVYNENQIIGTLSDRKKTINVPIHLKRK
ncbi:MAG: hypothetical protein Q8M15_06690 [Bacteroidota bacterium]|nr:hypothetical protein [Bacteroidota bacterium]